MEIRDFGSKATTSGRFCCDGCGTQLNRQLLTLNPQADVSVSNVPTRPIAARRPHVGAGSFLRADCKPTGGGTHSHTHTLSLSLCLYVYACVHIYIYILCVGIYIYMCVFLYTYPDTYRLYNKKLRGQATIFLPGSRWPWSTMRAPSPTPKSMCPRSTPKPS